MAGTFESMTLRYLGTDNPESFTLTPGELAGATDGLWVLGGNDTVIGAVDAELVNGNQGDDSLVGNGGDDLLLGGQNNDILFGGDATNMPTNDGNDFLSGNKGEDTLIGEDGNDLIFGGQGNDVLFGEDGNDTLSGNLDSDVLFGGFGADVFILRADPQDPTNSELADGILDFNQSGAEGDLIGLSDGLSEADLILQEEILPDPNIPTSTIISVRDSGAILGVVVGQSPSNVQGQFITI